MKRNWDNWSIVIRGFLRLWILTIIKWLMSMIWSFFSFGRRIISWRRGVGICRLESCLARYVSTVILLIRNTILIRVISRCLRSWILIRTMWLMLKSWIRQAFLPTWKRTKSNANLPHTYHIYVGLSGTKSRKWDGLAVRDSNSVIGTRRVDIGRRNIILFRKVPRRKSWAHMLWKGHSSCSIQLEPIVKKAAKSSIILKCRLVALMKTVMANLARNNSGSIPNLSFSI